MRKSQMLVAIPLLSGCLAGGFWGTVSSVRDAVTGEPAETQAPGEHNCACDLKGKSRSPFYWCDADGTRNDEGTHACCLGCGKVCGEVRGPQTERRSPGPVPVPVPPECDLLTHCKAKEECVVGGGHCCSKCKGACL